MSLAKKIAGNTVLRVAARLAGNAIGVVVVALLTRYLGAEGFGNYTTILAYLFFFGALSDLGLYMITINELNKAGVDRSRFYSAVYSLRFYTGIALLLVAIGLVWALPYPLIVKQGVAIMALSIFFNLLDQIQVTVYQVELNVKRIALGELLGKVVLLIGVVGGISLGVNLLALLWVVVLGQGVQWLFSFTGVAKRLKFRLNFDRSFWRQVISKTWPVALSQLFVLIYFKMDTVLLSLLRPPSIAQIEVGLYGASYKVLEVLIALVPVFMGLVTPLLSHAWSAGKRDEFKHMYQQVFDAFSIVTWPLVFGGIVLAKPIMALVAPGFTDSSQILQVLMIATGLIFFAHLPTYIVVAIGEQRRMLKAYALAAGLALVLYIILIPLFSYWAAAWVTVFIELIILIIAWRRIREVTDFKTDWQKFNKALLASLIMAVSLWLFRDLNLFILLAMGGAVYLLVMLVVKGITKDMIQKTLKGKETL